MFRNSVLVIIEISKPNKAPDLRYITIGSADNLKSDFEFGSQAIAAFQAEKNYGRDTVYTVKRVVKFDSQETYIKFLQNQLSDYLSSLKE